MASARSIHSTARSLSPLAIRHAAPRCLAQTFSGRTLSSCSARSKPTADFLSLLFASQITVELHQEDGCLEMVGKDLTGPEEMIGRLVHAILGEEGSSVEVVRLIEVRVEPEGSLEFSPRARRAREPQTLRRTPSTDANPPRPPQGLPRACAEPLGTHSSRRERS